MNEGERRGNKTASEEVFTSEQSCPGKGLKVLVAGWLLRSADPEDVA
jgi:hypothetical protein